MQLVSEDDIGSQIDKYCKLRNIIPADSTNEEFSIMNFPVAKSMLDQLKKSGSQQVIVNDTQDKFYFKNENY